MIRFALPRFNRSLHRISWHVEPTFGFVEGSVKA